MSSQPFKRTTTTTPTTKIDFRKVMRPLRASERYFVTTTFFFLPSRYIYIYFRKEKEKTTERRERERDGRGGEKKKRNELLCTLYMYVSRPPPQEKIVCENGYYFKELLSSGGPYQPT